jgi:hypothetical protein
LSELPPKFVDQGRDLMRCNKNANLPLFEIASVLLRLNHVASLIVNADHGIIALQVEAAED